MEESKNPSANSAFRPKDGSASSEESGWTMYFEDFMASEQRKAAGGFSFGVVSGSSMISDAASCVAWKPSSASLQVSENYRKLSLKKRKGLLHDDSLEDTASSPVNSPKVADLSYLIGDPNKTDDCRDTAQEDDVGNKNGLQLNQTLNGFDFVEKTDECRELKKRGLCLVPLSMLVDYLG
ncbi:hypothetical protein OPV22_031987 [Ensete ventricosum]|uniref:Uncharacterized protein n=1 Tax=Ensete ventricosum TaxID=4639 RepID=A0AAV8PLR7_ENSVE|nr:hypothetical protein OPV22_031987 [Ensete ventricosum]